MSKMRSVLYLVAVSAWLCGPGPRQGAAQPVPLGPEIRIDGSTSHFPSLVKVGVRPRGDFEVVWTGGEPSTFQDVFSRHFTPSSRPSDASPVLLGTGVFPTVKSVLPTPKGFEVLWQEQEQDWVLFFHYRRHLDPRGAPDSGEPVRLGLPALTRWVWQIRGNEFLAGWTVEGDHHEATGIAIQRLTPEGRLTGPVMQLTSRPVDVFDEPALVGLADGGFLAVWEGLVTRPGSSSQSWVLRARRFSPRGVPLGRDFDVLTTSLGKGQSVGLPHAAAAPGGGFAVTWLQTDESEENYRVAHLRLFGAAGRPLGPEILGPEGATWAESLAFDDAGNLLVLWMMNGPDLRVQLFDPAGTPLGPSVPVGSEASGEFKYREQGDVAWAKNSWVVAWSAHVQFSGALFVRRFAGPR
jgi:hypothetical protein